MEEEERKRIETEKWYLENRYHGLLEAAKTLDEEGLSCPKGLHERLSEIVGKIEEYRALLEGGEDD